MKLRKIVILIFTAMLGVGILASCTQNNGNQKGEMKLTEQEKKVIRKQEEALALFLVNNFEDVKTIEFISVAKGGFGTSDVAYMKINNNISVDSTLQDSYDINDYSLGYRKGSKPLVKKEVPLSFSKVEDSNVVVIYYGEKNE